MLTLPAQAVEQSGNFNSIGNGQYTFAPGGAGSADTFNGNVPNHATNADGSGTPAGAHASPGDTDYTAIWSGNDDAARRGDRGHAGVLTRPVGTDASGPGSDERRRCVGWVLEGLVERSDYGAVGSGPPSSVHAGGR